MTSRHSRSLVRSLLVCALFVPAGCGTTNEVTTPFFEMIVGDWTLVQIGDDAPGSLPAEQDRPTLEIDEEARVSGFAGVNRYGGALAPLGAARGGFSLGPISSTRMAGTPAAMELETRFLRGLEEATGYRLDGEVLVLEAGGESLLRFTRTGGD